jgi:hypothetical protein
VQKNYKLITGSFLAFNRDYNKKKSPANFIPNDNEYSSDVTFEMNWKEKTCQTRARIFKF